MFSPSSTNLTLSGSTVKSTIDSDIGLTLSDENKNVFGENSSGFYIPMNSCRIGRSKEHLDGSYRVATENSDSRKMDSATYRHADGHILPDDLEFDVSLSSSPSEVSRCPTLPIIMLRTMMRNPLVVSALTSLTVLDRHPCCFHDKGLSVEWTLAGLLLLFQRANYDENDLTDVSFLVVLWQLISWNSQNYSSPGFVLETCLNFYREKVDTFEQLKKKMLQEQFAFLKRCGWDIGVYDHQLLSAHDELLSVPYFQTIIDSLTLEARRCLLGLHNETKVYVRPIFLSNLIFSDFVPGTESKHVNTPSFASVHSSALSLSPLRDQSAISKGLNKSSNTIGSKFSIPLLDHVCWTLRGPTFTSSLNLFSSKVKFLHPLKFINSSEKINTNSDRKGYCTKDTGRSKRLACYSSELQHRNKRRALQSPAVGLNSATVAESKSGFSFFNLSGLTSWLNLN